MEAWLGTAQKDPSYLNWGRTWRHRLHREQLLVFLARLETKICHSPISSTESSWRLLVETVRGCGITCLWGCSAYPAEPVWFCLIASAPI